MAEDKLGKEEGPSLRRAVSIWGSFTWGYAGVGADIYMALGLILFYARGAAPYALFITGLLYVLIGLIYTELAASYPVAGGGQYYSLRGLGDFWGFVAGWAFLLDFTVDVSLFAYAAAGYFNFFFPYFQHSRWIPIVETLFLILFLMAINIRGIRESSRLNEIFCAVDIINESLIIIIGLLFAFKPELFMHQITREVPHMGQFLYSMTIAVVAFVGLEAISQAAEETIRPASIIPRTSISLTFVVLIYALAFSILGVGSLGWKPLAKHMSDPIAYLAKTLPLIGAIAGPFTAILGFTLLYASANTGVMGYSRVSYSMSKLQLLPRWFSGVHPRYRTPHRTILLFSTIVVIQLVLAGLSESAMKTLADMYAFGALASYTLVCISHLRLRLTDPYTPRPYKIPGNINVNFKGRKVDFPILGLIAIIGTSTYFVLVLATHHWARIFGPLWLFLGLIVYFLHRKKSNLPLFRSITRDWVNEQIKVLKEAGEVEALEEYLKALEGAKDETK
ncbi:APC family permease [bacterium]|nr:APC family permease [bacterium]